MRRDHNVAVIHGDPDDPHLPDRVNAVLIANTYHEFAHPRLILAAVYASLVPGGRLVVVDRAPGDNSQNIAGAHEMSADAVENDLRQAHFEIVTRQDHFIESDPDHETWWLIVAHRT